MEEKIKVIENKVLSLKNVVYKILTFEDIKESLEDKIYSVSSYIRSKNVNIIGPLIMLTQVRGKKANQIEIFAMFQVDNEAISINPPYQFIDVLKVGPCLYARYVGKEETSNIAQSKIRVYAFENDILLDNKIYSVFVDKKENDVVIDIFIPIILEKSVEQ